MKALLNYRPNWCRIFGVAIIVAILHMLTGCAVQDGAVQLDVLCNKTVVGRDGVHYDKQDLEHIHCDKKEPLKLVWSF